MKSPLNSIENAQRILHKAAPRFNFRKVSDPEFQADKFKWLAELTRGTWIVRLRAGNAVDHCVVIDGQRQEIEGSEERKPFRLSESSLRTCGGDGAVELYISEVRELHKCSRYT